MKPFIVSLLALLAIDSVWLTVMAKKFYSQHIGHIMASSPNLVPAGAFYLVYSLGITFFVVTPAIQNNSSLTKVFLTGALLGLVAYATYDLTNHATIKNWPTIVTLVDLIWGALLTGTVSLIAFYVTKHY
jgi:uncharacterized membrane protein